MCGDGFNDVAAAVVCKQMGHDHAVSWKSEQLQGIQVRGVRRSREHR